MCALAALVLVRAAAAAAVGDDVEVAGAGAEAEAEAEACFFFFFKPRCSSPPPLGEQLYKRQILVRLLLIIKVYKSKLKRKLGCPRTSSQARSHVHCIAFIQQATSSTCSEWSYLLFASAALNESYILMSKSKRRSTGTTHMWMENVC